MTMRDQKIQAFIDAASAAFRSAVRSPEASSVVDTIFSKLTVPAAPGTGEGLRLKACSHLAEAYARPIEDSILRTLVERFRDVESRAVWRQRPGLSGPPGSNLEDGYAHAMIAGPGGVEERSDIWLGASILAPHVTYPDHNHSPAEVYLLASDGEFKQGERDWFSPGVGGALYNVPHIKHAMRSTDRPFFAFWTLLSA